MFIALHGQVAREYNRKSNHSSGIKIVLLTSNQISNTRNADQRPRTAQFR